MCVGVAVGNVRSARMVIARSELQDLRLPGPWETVRVLKNSFSEQRSCMHAVHAAARRIAKSPSGTAEAFDVHVGPLPEALLAPRKNLFSTLFHATYLTLEIPRPRRMLYGKLNHLFRIWVTSADNLLDGEDKCVLPLVMPGTSRVMRDVVAIMTADRVLWRLLNDAVSAGTLTADQADVLAEHSLRCLLPSAAQEASEEGGIAERPAPEYVLDTIHVLKTGLLFSIPGINISARLFRSWPGPSEAHKANLLTGTEMCGCFFLLLFLCYVVAKKRRDAGRFFYRVYPSKSSLACRHKQRLGAPDSTFGPQTPDSLIRASRPSPDDASYRNQDGAAPF